MAGTTGGNATRSFTVPGNKYLLFPLINVSESEADSEENLTGEELENFVTSQADFIDSAFLEVNGLSIVDSSNFSDYREPSPLFSYTAVPNNVFSFEIEDTITAISVPEPTSIISLLAIGSLVTVTSSFPPKSA